MNIKAEKLITEGDVAYKILSIDKCCDKIINSPSIHINTEEDKNNPDFDYPEYSVKLYCGEDDEDWYMGHYEKINFCPFCGKPITIDVINERDVTKEYNELCKEVNKIRELILKTDSISEKNILEEKFKEIQIKRRMLVIDDDFKKED